MTAAGSMNRLEDRYRRLFFQIFDDGRWRVSRRIREAVRFSHFNIAGYLPEWAHHAMDVMLCRNLVIYFDEQSAERTIVNLVSVFWPVGFVVMGYADGVDLASRGLEKRVLGEVSVFQRPR